MTNLPQVRERIGAADFQTVAKFLPQSELGGTLAVSENEKAVVRRGGRVVDMFSGRSGRTPADSEVVVASLRHYHMVFGFGDCSRSPYNRAPAMIHVADLPEMETSNGEILRSMTVAIRFSLIRDDRSNVEKLLSLNAARRDAVTVRDLANDLDLPAFIRATFASVGISDERSIRFDEPYMDKVRQRILMAANIALGEYGASASAATLDIYATSRDAPRRLTESQREELAKHDSRMTQLDAQIEAERRRVELENLSNQREMLRTATMKHLEEQAEIQARIESLDPRPPRRAEPTKPRPSAPSAEPPPKPRNLMPLIAAGGFGAIIVIILVTLLASQSGDSAPDSPPRVAAVAPPMSTATPTSTPAPLPTSTATLAFIATPLPANTPTPVPTTPPLPTSAPMHVPTDTPTASPTPTQTQIEDAIALAITEALAAASPTPTQTQIEDAIVLAITEALADSDRDALITLYNATNGANWNNNDNWLSDRPIEEWHGVDVDDNGRVVDLVLWLNNLSGEIPPELGNLSNLRTLLLAVNNLSCKIPPTLGDLANLEGLHLNGNGLSGEIPPELGNLSNLVELHLHNNQLTGCIPQSLRQALDAHEVARLRLPFC